jgi:hypothetical protein
MSFHQSFVSRVKLELYSCQVPCRMFAMSSVFSDQRSYKIPRLICMGRMLNVMTTTSFAISSLGVPCLGTLLAVRPLKV